jgi:hypothetical protein
MHIPITAGYAVQAKAAADVEANLSVAGSVKFGFQHDHNEGFHYVHEHDFSKHSGDLAVDQASLSLQASVFLQPTVMFSVDAIGGGSLSLKAYAEPTIVFDAVGSPCSADGTGAGARYGLNVGYQITAGAHVGVQYHHKAVGPNKEFGPDAVHTSKWPLATGCIHLPEAESAPGPVSPAALPAWYAGQHAFRIVLVLFCRKARRGCGALFLLDACLFLGYSPRYLTGEVMWCSVMWHVLAGGPALGAGPVHGPFTRTICWPLDSLCFEVSVD